MRRYLRGAIGGVAVVLVVFVITLIVGAHEPEAPAVLLIYIVQTPFMWLITAVLFGAGFWWQWRKARPEG